MDLLPNNNREGFSPFGIFLLLLILLFLGSAIGSGLGFLLGMYMDYDLTESIASFNENSPARERNFIRVVNLFNQLFTFTVPALILGYIVRRSEWPRFFLLHRSPGPAVYGAGVFFIFGVFLLSLTGYWLNQQLPLPDWAGSMEEGAARLTRGLLVMDSAGEFLLTLLVVAVLPAIGEELVFRGALQRQFRLSTGNPLLAIWLSALIFSAFHLQFAGVLPRMLLGAGLGYLYYWTRSLWVPIVAHFLVNGMQIIVTFVQREEMAQPEELSFSPGATALGAGLVAVFSHYLYQHFQKNIKAAEKGASPEAS